jgi:hypothetical protein
MKRIIFAVVLVLILTLVLVTPASAGNVGSQNYKLDSIIAPVPPPLIFPPPPAPIVPPVYFMQNSAVFQGQTGLVQILPGTSAMWVVNQQAAAPVIYPWGRWDVDLTIDPAFANVLLGDFILGGIPQMVQVGDYNPVNGTFTPFIMNQLVALSAPVPGPVLPPGAAETTELQLQGPAATVLAGDYLALRVINLSAVVVTVYCDLQPNGANLPSCVTSPQTDPGYPLPEVAAGILMGSGLLGLGGFLWFRRRYTEAKI